MRPEASPERARSCLKYDHADYRRLVAAVRRRQVQTSSAAVVRPEPGPVRRWLKPEVSESERAAWRAVLRRPGIAAWALLFALVGLGLGSSGLQSWVPEALASAQRDAVFEARVRSTLDRVLGAFRPGVQIDRLEVVDLPWDVAAKYTYRLHRITVNTGIEHYSDDELLHVLSHEVVHAMLDQGNLRLYGGTSALSSFVLSEEIAADLLGAHLAGLVRTRAGDDGMELTDRLVREHRERSDPRMPGSYYQRFERARASFGPNAVDPIFEHSVFLHYGSPERVDEVDRICRENPDPWDAAREISRRYLTWHEEQKTLRERLAELAEED